MESIDTTIQTAHEWSIHLFNAVICNLRDHVALLGGECWNIPVRRTSYAI